MKRPTKIDRAPRHPVLPDDACPACGTAMKATVAELSIALNGERVAVPGVQHFACPSCGEVVLRHEDAKALRERAVEVYRRSRSLLSAGEIRAVRQRLNLTQAQFASLLQLGLNTVSRWESGRNVQNGAMDVLLKVVRDVPGTLAYLKKLAA